MPGLELKARGTQVVAPPSIHPDTGKLYADDPSGPSWGTLAFLPAQIAERAPCAPSPTLVRFAEPTDDYFLKITPRDYAYALAGATANRNGFICCPSPANGEERTPSLKLYDTPEAGWACFRECCRQPDGRRAGGGIYQFAAHMVGYAGELRGAEFLTVQAAVERRYEDLLLNGAA